jgi:hypothetical protein
VGSTSQVALSDILIRWVAFGLAFTGRDARLGPCRCVKRDGCQWTFRVWGRPLCVTCAIVKHPPAWGACGKRYWKATQCSCRLPWSSLMTSKVAWACSITTKTHRKSLQVQEVQKQASCCFRAKMGAAVTTMADGPTLNSL